MSDNLDIPPEIHPDAIQLSIDTEGLEPVAIYFPYRGRKYVLREATEDAAVKYQNCVFRATKLGPDGPTGVEGLANADPLLVSLCLFEVDAPGAKGNTPETAISEAWVRAQPHKFIRRLADKAKEISDLQMEENEETLRKTIDRAQKKLNKLLAGKKSLEELAKNEQDGGTLTSTDA